MTRWGAAVAIGLALLTGCGAKSSGSREEAAPPTTAVEAPAGDGAAAAGSPSASTTPTSAKQSTQTSSSGGSAGTTTTTVGGSPPTTYEVAGSGVNSRLPLSATVNPKCAKRGQPVKVDATTRPHASIAAMASYEDGASPEPGTIGTADRDGRWTWTVVVPADAPLGQGRIDLLAEDRTPQAEGASTNQDNAHGVYFFTVAKSC
jgi:hypothetical protein